MDLLSLVYMFIPNLKFVLAFGSDVRCGELVVQKSHSPQSGCQAIFVRAFATSLL